jgi:hypothetical protein
MLARRQLAAQAEGRRRFLSTASTDPPARPPARPPTHRRSSPTSSRRHPNLLAWGAAQAAGGASGPDRCSRHDPTPAAGAPVAISLHSKHCCSTSAGGSTSGTCRRRWHACPTRVCRTAQCTHGTHQAPLPLAALLHVLVKPALAVGWRRKAEELWEAGRRWRRRPTHQPVNAPHTPRCRRFHTLPISHRCQRPL